LNDAISRVARSLTALEIRDVVFVGGAAVGLLLTDPGSPEVRATYDVDAVSPANSRSAFNQIEAQLRSAGYRQPPGGPICRWIIEGITVDLLPAFEGALGFTNRWYPQVLEHANDVTLPDGTRAFAGMLASSDFLEALPGHLHGDAASQERAAVILRRMRSIAALDEAEID
jgi:hypothetical protein